MSIALVSIVRLIAKLFAWYTYILTVELDWDFI